MGVRMVIELPDAQGAETVLRALESYRGQLRASIGRAEERLATFEQRYGQSTSYFLDRMAAEDLSGGDLEYVEWAGEARLLSALKAELAELEHARCQLP